MQNKAKIIRDALGVEHYRCGIWGWLCRKFSFGNRGFIQIPVGIWILITVMFFGVLIKTDSANQKCDCRCPERVLIDPNCSVEIAMEARQ